MQDIAYLYGQDTSFAVGIGKVTGWVRVFDLYDFEYGYFEYAGKMLTYSAGIEWSIYHGVAKGWSTFIDKGVHNFKGVAYDVAFGGSLGPASVGLDFSVSEDGKISGPSWYFTMGLGYGSFLDVSASLTEAVLRERVLFHQPCKNPTVEEVEQFIDFLEEKLPGEAFRTLAQNKLRRYRNKLERWYRWNEG
jgi:hypothetical protein